jgi:type VI secretion system secreted protein VgrG
MQRFLIHSKIFHRQSIKEDKMPFTQENRSIIIDTPLGRDVLVLTGIAGSEGISVPFMFTLDILSENHNISFQNIIAKNVTVSVALASGEKRFINGLVSRFSQGRGGGEAGGDPRFSYYRAEIVPWFWLLKRTSDSRIFQGLSVPDIIEKIFTEKSFTDYKIKLQGTYAKRNYCIQYRETDFNFVCRLMEEEGIYYFFEHEEKMHTLVISDVPHEHKPCPNQANVQYQISEGGQLEEDTVSSLEFIQEIRAGKYTLNDFNFETPNTSLLVEVPSKYKLGSGERELYDFPGGYDKRAGGDQFAKVRMQEEETAITTINGGSNCRAFTSGYRFQLKGFYRDDMNNKEYVLTSVYHEASQEYVPGEEAAELSYANNFSCIPFDVPFRPGRITPRPVVEGVQTAIVVGPGGEEIYTDEHGRVKVQFHWDREGKKNENSSCWIRVSQAWAGASWGAMYVPRIGHEVIVDFEEGDPDRPIITGRVYHGTNKPPYALPGEKTKSTIKSNSTPGGGGSNELRFEDKKGNEEIYLHAQKDQNILVEAAETHTVGANRTVHVKGHFKETIDGGEDRTVTAGSKETISGGKTETIDGGEKRAIAGGVKESIDGGETRSVNGGQTITVNGGVTETVNAGETRTVNGGLTETVNGSLTQTVTGGITINSPAGVTITAPGGYTVVAPGGTRTIDSWFTKIGGKDEDLFAVQTAILSMQTTIAGMSTAIQGIKIDTTGVAFERCGVKSANEPLTIKQASTKLKNGAIGLYMYGLTLIN